MFEIDFFERTFLDNRVDAYLTLFLIILFGVILKKFIAGLISKQVFRIIKNKIIQRYSQEFLNLFKKPFERLIFVLVLYFAFNQLTFPESWQIEPVSVFGLRWILMAVFKIALIYIITNFILRIADFWEYVISNDDNTTISPDLARFIKEFAKVIIVLMGVFAVLAKVFEVNIITLVTSLGIGGLAIALAAQDTLANLIASFIIYLDKPFNVGDLIDTGEVRGKVEKVGFRTTRIRTVDKSLVTIPNKKLADSTLNNITRSDQRRVYFKINLTYSSTSHNILNIIEDIKMAISLHPNTSDEMVVRFTEFDASSLNIEIIYFVNSNDYNMLMETKEDLNIKIMEIVEKHNCEFAFPTQTIHVSK